MILRSYYKGWTIAENFIAEKNLSHAAYDPAAGRTTRSVSHFQQAIFALLSNQTVHAVHFIGD
jgi:hypothetical protein